MKSTFLAVFAALFVAAACPGQSLDPALKAKVDARAKLLQPWSTDAKIVDAVKAYNAAPSAEVQAMTNEKWKTLTVLDPLVRSFSRNALAEYLKTKREPVFAEIFVSGANGGKVAFLSKTSNWSHKGKDKHQVPMTGKTWVGPVELDESSGEQTVQVGFPVLDGKKPIGSIVVGLSVSKLK